MAPLASRMRTWLATNYPEQKLSVVELGDLSPRPPGIYRFSTCFGKGLIGRAVTSPPDLAVCKAPDRRSGRIPALPYLPLEQRVYFPFPFPLGSIGRETGNGSLS